MRGRVTYRIKRLREVINDFLKSKNSIIEIYDPYTKRPQSLFRIIKSEFSKTDLRPSKIDDRVFLINRKIVKKIIL